MMTAQMKKMKKGKRLKALTSPKMRPKMMRIKIPI
jgi:hypothetical protein